MSSKSLYRIHRPKQFADVVGQDPIVKTLVNQIAKNNLSHAYLFAGTRGTGKTSVARIFASALNCAGFAGGKICGKCEYCKKAAGGNIDIFELDAASNNRVEDVREIIEKTKYPPIFSKYKVYIIDEVHMFSGSAFNAFLKVLEEPPAHVIFILATTEVHKLPATILSRVLRFDFKTVADAQIEKLLTSIFKKENIRANPAAIAMIAKAGAGSVRDALSFADMVVNYSDGEITEDIINTVAGSVSVETLEKLLSAILDDNTDEITKICNKIFSIGRNVVVVVKDMLKVIKSNYLKTKSAEVAEIFKTFAELEFTIKTATDAGGLFENTCLLCGFKKKR
jgi:DNA polymerase-3 subunit gamma/tau